MQADGKEERLIVLLAQLLDAVVGDLVVVDVLIFAVDGRELDTADTIALSWSGLGRTTFVWQVVIPFAAAGVGFVVNLAGTANVVAAIAEGGGEHLLGRQYGAPVVVVLVDAGGAGAQSAHEGGAGRIADGCGAVAAGEAHAACGQGVDVRGGRLGIAAKVVDPVVEVVHGNEEDIGLVCRQGGLDQKNQEE